MTGAHDVEERGSEDDRTEQWQSGSISSVIHVATHTKPATYLQKRDSVSSKLRVYDLIDSEAIPGVIVIRYDVARVTYSDKSLDISEKKCCRQRRLPA